MRIDRLYKWPIRDKQKLVKFTWNRRIELLDPTFEEFMAWKHNTNITDLMTNCGGYVP